MSHLQPFGNQVVVHRIEAETMTKGGLYLPDGAKERPQQGLILALPADYAGPLAVGQQVLFSKYSGHDFTIDAVEVVVLKQEEVLAKVVPGSWPAPKIADEAPAEPAKPKRSRKSA